MLVHQVTCRKNSGLYATHACRTCMHNCSCKPSNLQQHSTRLALYQKQLFTVSVPGICATADQSLGGMVTWLHSDHIRQYMTPLLTCVTDCLMSLNTASLPLSGTHAQICWLAEACNSFLLFLSPPHPSPPLPCSPPIPSSPSSSSPSSSSPSPSSASASASSSAPSSFSSSSSILRWLCVVQSNPSGEPSGCLRAWSRNRSPSYCVTSSNAVMTARLMELRSWWTAFCQRICWWKG